MKSNADSSRLLSLLFLSDKEKQFHTTRNLIVTLLLLVAAPLLVCGQATSARPNITTNNNISGRWTGSWNNSRGESGESTININEGRNAAITGQEAGVNIENGRRSGNVLTWEYRNLNNGCDDYKVRLEISADGRTANGTFNVTDRCGGRNFNGRYVNYQNSGASAATGEPGGQPEAMPGGEGVAEYKDLPDRRSLSVSAFIADAQPGDREAEGRCGDLSGKWRIKTSEGSSTWELWKTDYARVYGGREPGGNAKTLAALLQGNVLRLQFDSVTEQGRIFGGTFNCQLDASCQSSLSPCKLIYDLNRKGSFEATIKRQ